MNSFNQHTEFASRIMLDFEVVLRTMETYFKIKFKDPHHDISRRFLNEIKEFEPSKEVIE